MRITEPTGPFLCPTCAQGRRSSLRYCDGDAHQLLPECPEHRIPLRWTNGGPPTEVAVCNLPTGTDSRGRRTWCKVRRTIVHYDDVGRPTPAREWPAQTIGRSVRRALAESPRRPEDMTVTIALVAPGTGIHQAQSPSSGGFRDVQGLTEGGGADVPHLAAEVHDSTGRRPC